MKEAVTAQEMKEIEKAAACRGISYLTMMENAGSAAAETIIKEYQPAGKIVIIVVGKGNNGGDGYVVARLLQAAGAMVMIIMAEGLPATDSSAKTNFDRCMQCGIEMLQYESPASDLLFQGADIIIDAVYGAGFHGNLREPAASAIQAINASDAKVVALDLPSGLNADTGESAPDAIRADTTITFARLKKGQTSPNGLQLCGKLILKDIGLE